MGEELPAVQGFTGVANDDPLRMWGDQSTAIYEDMVKSAIERNKTYHKRNRLGAMSRVQFLAISGGGQHGAFGAGLLCGMTAAGTRPEYEVVTGISTGALIAPFAFLGPKYDDTLKLVYTTTSTRDVVDTHMPGRLLFGDGLFGSKPLRQLIARHITADFLEAVAAQYDRGRLLLIGTTHLDAERPVTWNMGAIAKLGTPEALELFHDVMLASASIPGGMPPVMIDIAHQNHIYDEMHVDGGTTGQVIFYPLSLNLEDLGDEMGIRLEQDLYVIRNAFVDPKFQSIKQNTIPIVTRSISTLIKTQGHANMYQLFLASQRDDVNMFARYIPQDFDLEPDEFFDEAFMNALFEVGYDLAKLPHDELWIEAPPGFEPVDTD